MWNMISLMFSSSNYSDWKGGGGWYPCHIWGQPQTHAISTSILWNHDEDVCHLSFTVQTSKNLPYQIMAPKPWLRDSGHSNASNRRVQGHLGDDMSEQREYAGAVIVTANELLISSDAYCSVSAAYWLLKVTLHSLYRHSDVERHALTRSSMKNRLSFGATGIA
jgi:hypothetical protein